MLWLLRAILTRLCTGMLFLEGYQIGGRFPYSVFYWDHSAQRAARAGLGHVRALAITAWRVRHSGRVAAAVALIVLAGLVLLTLRPSVYDMTRTTHLATLLDVSTRDNQITLQPADGGEPFVLHCTNAEAFLLQEKVGSVIHSVTYQCWSEDDSTLGQADGTRGNLLDCWIAPEPAADE